jgi:penicillin-binding protein 1A
MPERNTVFDVDGKIYSRLAGANRLKVSLKEVSPFFIQALLVREDARFYQHGGIDWRGVARALVRDVTTRSLKEARAASRSSSRAIVFLWADAISAGSCSRRWWRCALSAK